MTLIQHFRHSRITLKNGKSMIKREYPSLWQAILPKDYPHSVHTGYVRYSAYSFGAQMVGTAGGTLATQALLQSLTGISGTGMVAASATANWILKDGFGLLGGALAAAIVSQRFDAHPRRFRSLSNLLIQGATLVELLTPMIPGSFLVLASLSNVAKNIGWLAASASRAAIHASFCHCNNLGDVTAKSGVQSTIASLLGTALAIGINYTIGSDANTLMACFLPLVTTNLLLTHASLTHVTVRSISVERLELLMKAFFTQGQFLTPEQISKQEPILFGKKSTMLINPNLVHYETFYNEIEEQLKKQDYAIVTTLKSFCVFLKSGMSDSVLLKAMIHANYVRYNQSWSEAYFNDIEAQLTALGWDLQSLHIGDRQEYIHLEC